MLKRITLTTAFAILCVAGTAAADPIVLPNGPLYIKFENLEMISGANDLVVPGGYNGTDTQGNWGLVSVTSMHFGGIFIDHQEITSGAGFFLDDGTADAFGQGQITGIFYDIQLTGATTATGGILDLYWYDPASDFVDANCLAGISCVPDAATVGAFTGGTFLVRLVFDTGIITGDNVTTISSSCDPTTIQGGTCEADSFASVDTSIIGAWTLALNGDWFWVDTDGDGNFGEAGETRDVRFSNIFFLAPGTNWDLKSNDPARAFVGVVPEPATLTLLGLGLAGLGYRRRRRA